MVEVPVVPIGDENMSDEEALLRITQAMKQNTPSQDDKNNMHTFLLNVVQEKEIDKISKIGNLKDDKTINEIGIPMWNVRGALDMAMMSDMLMDNDFFTKFFEKQASNTLITSLSREGFLIKMNSVTTKQVADTTRRRKINRGMFGKKTEEISGGDITS